jgi:two-component system sensor histidine kinase UhpB
MEVEENERKRLGHELHDDLGQLLTAMELRMAAAGKNPDIEALESISERMRQSLASVVNALGPGDLNQAGLYEALANGSLRQLCELAGIRYLVRFQGNGNLWSRLSSATVLAAYRIVQEGVNNAVKYAQCRRLDVRLRIGQHSGNRDRILLMIDMRDDGVGLDEAAIRSGFHSIRDRALAFDGEVHISGRNGLRVHVLLRQ